MLAHQLKQARHILKHGGVIAYSTETVLGLGCDPKNQEAVQRILWLKQREVDKGLIVVVSSITDIERYTEPLSNKQSSTITLSENTTWLIPANKHTPYWLTGEHTTIAVRISKHEISGQLASKNHGIVSTSANMSSYKTLSSVKEIRDWFGPHIDYVIIGGAGSGIPSRICDLLSGKVLR